MNVGRSRPMFPRWDHLTTRLFDQSTSQLPALSLSKGPLPASSSPPRLPFSRQTLRTAAGFVIKRPFSDP